MKIPYLVGLGVIVTMSVVVLVYDALIRPNHTSAISHDGHQHNEHHLEKTQLTIKDDHSSSNIEHNNALSQHRITPIPTNLIVNQPLAKVGWMLFKDRNLS